MTHRRRTHPATAPQEGPAARSLVLDSQALSSLLLRDDRHMVIRIEAARRVGVPVLVSALTVVEAVFGKTGTARLRWVLFRLEVHDITQADSFTAVQLLSDADGLHGHKYAIDALVAAMALRSAAPLERGPMTATTDRNCAATAHRSSCLKLGVRPLTGGVQSVRADSGGVGQEGLCSEAMGASLLDSDTAALQENSLLSLK